MRNPFETVGKRDFSGLGIIDYGLMGVGTMLAAMSGGLAIGQPSISIFSSVLIGLGTMVAYIVRRLARGSKWLILDAPLYTTACLCAAFFSVPLMSIMPEGGFPKELFAAGWLSWMLIFGSFVSWRDSTLLFQAVPSIALFGLVGVYDTFHGAVFAFFGFLVCLTTFFARAHGRQKLADAIGSGYFSLGLAPGSPEPTAEWTPGLMEKLRSGPWRWIAGPEWALASALIVALISLLGAPVIQSSMEGVTGFVRLNAPKLPQVASIAAVANPARDSTTIGRGPVELISKPVLEVEIDRPRFLRTATYDVYSGRGWRRPQALTNPTPGSDPISAAIDNIARANADEFYWSIHPLAYLRTIPVPGEPIGVTPGGIASAVRPDGTLQFGDVSADLFEGESVSVKPEFTPRDAVRNPPEILGKVLDTAAIPGSVRQLAHTVADSRRTDWEKALAIQHEIENRVVYSINTPETPDGQDPIEYTLFQSKLAYCDLFASSMVAMARSVGIPARYVTGFMVRSDRSLGQRKYVVEQRDAHAWAELLFKNAGWVIFDATEGATSIDGEGVGAASDDRSWYQKPLAAKLINYAIVLCVLVAVGMLVKSRWKRIREPNYLGEIETSYVKFASLLRKASGSRRMPGTTADEYLRQTASKIPGAETLAASINRDFNRIFYSPEGADAAAVAKIKARINELRKLLASSRSK